MSDIKQNKAEPEIMENQLVRWTFVIVTFIVYAAAFIRFYPLVGTSLGAFAAIPVLTAAFLFGFWPGITAALLTFPINTFLYYLVGITSLDVAMQEGSGPKLLVLLIIGAVVGRMREIRDRLRSELAERKKVNEQLERMDRTKNEFLSFVTHDLKNPLVSVLGYSDVLLGGMGGEMTEKQKYFVEVIKRNGKVLQEMIESLLDYTRLEFGRIVVNPEFYSLNAQAITVLEEIRPQFDQKKITFEADLPQEELMVNLDKKMIYRVLSNLLGNAAKYTPEGGRVKFSLSRAGGMARVRVEDNGIGIPKEHLAKVFDKFYLINSEKARERHSLGLGLYIAKNFVLEHGGKIWAESEGEGKGAKFFVELPVA